MATSPKKPSWEKEEARSGDMMFDVHPLHSFQPSPSRKLNRENHIKNTCHSKGHRNIAPSNDKRPLSVQIPATSSASLVSTSLPVQRLRPSNFFFYRGIFLNRFLRHQILIIRCVLYVMHEVTNLSDYASALSGHKVAPSGFAYFCPRNRKGVSVSLRK